MSTVSRHWRRSGFPARALGTPAQFLASVGRGHEPVGVMLTCSELGTRPDEMAHARPGELFVIQNPAGYVPAWHDQTGIGIAASLACALAIPTVRHVIVCGHHNCRLLRSPQHARSSSFAPVALSAAAVSERGAQLTLEAPSAATETFQACERFVLQQLLRLRKYPDVSSLLDEEHIVLHAWVYDDQSARIRFYQPELHQFRI